MSFRLALFVASASLVLAPSVSAAFEPIQWNLGERALPRVRPGVIHIPAGQAAGRVRVIGRLALPPLAARLDRALASTGPRHRLDVRSASARAYLGRLAAAQDAMAAKVRRAIPEARIGRRFRIVLDGITVSLPVRKLPRLVALGLFTRVYPSLSYSLALDHSPAVIGAPEVRRLAGADGTGIKIAVVDDGIDESNLFFAPQGLRYPAGFPRGARKWTTPKVIVARVFPGPHAGRPGRLAVDPKSSFHGTHVAGIAAGDSGTTAPAGADHPLTHGLSGVAPRAWLGNYRVFTVPSPVGHVANSPEIIAAFEAAVADGMDVINFSGGGAETDPANDALIEAVHNVAAAGVVPVIAAGNDRDEFGLGSAGSPGTAPDAISVAAVSAGHVFAPVLSVATAGAPAALHQIPYLAASSSDIPRSWAREPQQLVDVGLLTGRSGRPIERHLCGGPRDTASADGELRPHALDGAIALAERGLCPFSTKARQARAAGATGLILSDNRQGEANELPTDLPLPSAAISNLDGERLRAFVDAHRGRTSVRWGRQTLEDIAGRSTGVMTSFSSAGPTAFGHLLKPDLAAPGAQILSSTLPSTDRSRFAVFDGTSMATPHVTGAAALLLQLHRSWTPLQVKSALVATAGPAWGDTEQAHEASVLLEGGGLVNLPRAADPEVFTDPTSLSFGDLDAGTNAAERTLLLRVADAGGGDGTWAVSLSPQSATAGARLDAPGTIAIFPGGDAVVSVVARADAGARFGENYGFLVLRRGDVTRRIPYLFVVEQPALAHERVAKLEARQIGTTRRGKGRVTRYRYPVALFGNAPDQPPMDEDGAEHVYVFQLQRPAANVGVVARPRRRGVRVEPFFLGSQDENDVQGFAGTPLGVNELAYDFDILVGAAGASLPSPRTFYVAVDSGRNRFNGRPLGGAYLLHTWVNDVTPPQLRLLTTRVAAGRPTLAVETRDLGAGVDPYSLTIEYRGVLVGASSYDPVSGVALFPLPESVATLGAGSIRLTIQASDFQEAKNVNTSGSNVLPNTRFVHTRLAVVSGPTVTWLEPAARACVRSSTHLRVVAGSTGALRGVRFAAGSHTIGVAQARDDGVASVTWRPSASAEGREVLTATVVDEAGRTASARRTVRPCR